MPSTLPIVRPVALALATALLASCSGGQHPWSRSEICDLPWTGAVGQVPPADALLTLMVAGYNPTTRRATSPAVDCTGKPVEWTAPAFACLDTPFARKLLPDGPIAPEDVLVAPAADGAWIVWVVTGRYAAGDALGPVAIVTAERSRLVVRALGTLRSFTDRPALRLERIGAEELVVAEGDACAGADPSKCARSARLLPVAGWRLAQDVIRAPDGRCVSPAIVDLSRALAKGPDGRRYELRGSTVFGPAGMQVDELVLAYEGGGDGPGRLAHRAQDTRLVRLRDGQLGADGPSLWDRVTGGAR